MANHSVQQSKDSQAGSQPANTDIKRVRKFEQILQQSVPSILSSIPKDKRAALAQASFQASEMLVIHQGPLPEPETLARYGEIIPDGADRIMKMAEAQSQHRIGLENTIVNSQQNLAKRGQTFGLIIGIFALAVSGYLAINGHDTVASVVGGTTVVGLVIAFISGRRVQQKELQEKATKQ